MPESHLMQLDAAPELFADAILVDACDNLLFLSLWGRDTALQEFLARVSLIHHEGGLDNFFLNIGIKANGEPQRKLVQIGKADRLNHHTGRMPTNNVFGNMAHLWLFDQLIAEPDIANRRTIALFKQDDVASKNDVNSIHHRIWHLAKAICHLPLLDHWADAVINLFYERDWIKDFDGIGINGALIDLSLGEEIEEEITHLIKDGVLTLN